MKAGRELDLIVAEKLFGLCVEDTWSGKKTPVSAMAVMEHARRFDRVPHYSTDIAAAWEVVKKLGIIVCWYEGQWVSGTIEKYEMGFAGSNFYLDGTFDCQSVSETAPHAICLTALKAIGPESL